MLALIDQAGADVVAEEHLFDWHRAAAVADPDLGIVVEIGDGSLDQAGRAGRPIDVDWRRALRAPLHGHEVAEPASVIVVAVGNEDGAEAAEVEFQLGETARRAIAGVDEIGRAVDDQEVRRLRPFRPRNRPTGRAHGNQASSGGRRLLGCALVGRAGDADGDGRRKQQQW
jgi:hypothetical protein